MMLLIRGLTVNTVSSFNSEDLTSSDVQLTFAFPEEVLYGTDLAWVDGGSLGPECVADQYVEFHSRFCRLRPRDAERTFVKV